MSFTNPDPNLHIDLLKSQYAVFSAVLKRIEKTEPLDEKKIQNLKWELYVLHLYIDNYYLINFLK